MAPFGKASTKNTQSANLKKPDFSTGQLPTPVSALSPASEHVVDQVRIYKAAVSPLRTSLDMMESELEKLQIKGPSKSVQDNVEMLHTQMERFKNMNEAERTIIQDNFDAILKDEVDAIVQKLVNEGLEKYLDECIKANVAKRIKQLNLKREAALKLKESEEQLKKLQVELHNAESVRLNGFLMRGNDDNEPLNTILKPNGKVSEHFPQTFQELCNLTPALAKKLLKEYNIPDGIFTPHEDWRAVNRFMYFVGASYQLP